MAEGPSGASKPGGYGRYTDDLKHVGCPRAKSDMTPCVARDGSLGETHEGLCVGCGANSSDLLAALVREVTEPPESEHGQGAPDA